MVGWNLFFIKYNFQLFPGKIWLLMNVIELKLGRKKIFFIVSYRSPAFKHSSPEFDTFLSEFGDLYSKIKGGNPYATLFTGDFNAHS